MAEYDPIKAYEAAKEAEKKAAPPHEAPKAQEKAPSDTFGKEKESSAKGLESIVTHAPPLKYNMNTPLGRDVQVNDAKALLQKDINSINKERAKHYSADKPKEPLVRSQDMLDRKHGILSSEFNKEHDRGK